MITIALTAMVVVDAMPEPLPVPNPEAFADPGRNYNQYGSYSSGRGGYNEGYDGGYSGHYSPYRRGYSVVYYKTYH